MTETCLKCCFRGVDLMTPEQFKVEIALIFDSNDTETAHYLADALMCRLLGDFGYHEGVDVYREAPKRHA